MNCKSCGRPTHSLRRLEAQTFHKIDKLFLLYSVCDTCWSKLIKAVESTVVDTLFKKKGGKK